MLGCGASGRIITLGRTTVRFEEDQVLSCRHKGHELHSEDARKAAVACRGTDSGRETRPAHTQEPKCQAVEIAFRLWAKLLVGEGLPLCVSECSRKFLLESGDCQGGIILWLLFCLGLGEKRTSERLDWQDLVTGGGV